ncbi:hypothetical protein PVAP13_1NG111800 [Panicum virgatum]|uniref:Uncharacterized protein n=1 Tax=Panicum virgatum TaxID=38727 RepID=A0A8T0WIA5_PANVG|nr:hypothetical protein PVAP13_1NG111800 [Panicum virgatum]
MRKNPNDSPKINMDACTRHSRLLPWRASSPNNPLPYAVPVQRGGSMNPPTGAAATWRHGGHATRRDAEAPATPLGRAMGGILLPPRSIRRPPGPAPPHASRPHFLSLLSSSLTSLYSSPTSPPPSFPPQVAVSSPSTHTRGSPSPPSLRSLFSLSPAAIGFRFPCSGGL